MTAVVGLRDHRPLRSSFQIGLVVSGQRWILPKEVVELCHLVRDVRLSTAELMNDANEDPEQDRVRWLSVIRKEDFPHVRVSTPHESQ
jgi:hypothetical protein